MKIFEILRFIIISLEAIILLILLTVFRYFPEIFESIGSQILSNKDVWKFLPTIPLIICGFSIKYAWKILTPFDNTSNRVLYEWPNYWKLKYRVLFSIFICGICVISAIIIWIFSSKLSFVMIGFIFITSCIIPLTVALNQLLAAFKIRELMEL
jgi:hypothetical protein